MKTVITKGNDVTLSELGGGVSRKVLAHDGRMMVVEVRFEKGGIGSVHKHPHTQATYVKSGAFRFTIEGEDHDVKEGDTLIFEPDEAHGTLCQEKGILIDVFTPQRDDFLQT